tara:strand:+ start:602 stop:781 length:180 start_codon:yes stop_codon:yes gene_type:complete
MRKNINLKPGDMIRIKKYCKIGGLCGIIVKSNGMFLKALMQTGEIIDVIGTNCEVVSES